MIKLGFFGAAGEVTGSCYIVSTARAQVMVDLGMHQGEREAEEHNRRLPPHALGKLDAVVLTHAHLDHCGRLPLLFQNGYRGKIYCTAATANITEIILRDSARLQAEDYERSQRHGNNRQGRLRPLYSEQDVERTLTHLTQIDYSQAVPIADGFAIELFDAGHILGAASVRMSVTDGTNTKFIVFSGDVGPVGAPIVRDPVTPPDADAVLLESTYGDHDHRSLEATRDEFLSILQDACAARSKVIIPAFALGRAQDLIYHLGDFIRTRKLQPLDVFIDSPMATSISGLYAHYVDLYDEHAADLVRKRIKPLGFPGLTYTQTVEESKSLNDKKGPMVVIAASGMCTGGRILHHLRHNLPEREAHVVIVGYQGRGTLGRRLVDGAKYVSIFGSDVPVRAKVHTLGGFSAHAGQSGLLNWAASFQQRKPRLFLTHGEDVPRQKLRDQLQSRFGFAPELPYYGDEAEL
jgi:metallo-beta-lactamase family protein